MKIIKHCPECGSALSVQKKFPQYWSALLKCPDCPASNVPYYLYLVDLRFGGFPLESLEVGVAALLLECDKSLLDLAFSRLKRIDYRTISIVAFQHTLLGIYDEARNYEITYRS